MKKRYGLVALTAALLFTGLLMGGAQTAVAAPPGAHNILLVHGAFADGSGWEAVAKLLEKDGYTVSILQEPETSYAESPWGRH